MHNQTQTTRSFRQISQSLVGNHAELLDFALHDPRNQSLALMIRLIDAAIEVAQVLDDRQTRRAA
jgi:hypothetical protein